MAKKKDTKKKVSLGTISTWITIVVYVSLALLMGLVVFENEYDVIDSQIVTAIPPTPIATSTPSDFEVVGEIKRLQIVGGDWDGYRTWVTLTIVSAERAFQKGEVYNLKLPIEANTELEEGQHIKLMCFWANSNRMLNCSSDYELLEKQQPSP